MYSTARRSLGKANHWETVLALIRITSSVLAVYWVGIFVATHMPSSSLPSLGSDKVYHLLAFAGLAFLLNWVISHKLASVGKQVVIVLTICVVYAIFDEWSQQFVAGRQPDVNDAIADSCGAVLGLLSFRAASALRATALGRLSGLKGLSQPEA